MRLEPRLVTIYLDMDGVLVNFDKKFQEHFPGVHEDDDWLWEDLYKVCPDIYLTAEPMPDMNELLKYVWMFGYKKILTAIPKRWSWPKVTDHKRQWIARHIPSIPHTEVCFGPYAEDKQYHCKGSHDVLIDDKERNILQWRARGGTGILHTSAADTIKQLGKLIG